MAILFLLADPRSLGLNITFSKICAAEIALINNFIWNELWTFRRTALLRQTNVETDGLRDIRDSRKGVVRRLLVFNAVCGSGIVLAVGLLYLFHTSFNWDLYASNIVAIVLVTFWNFAVNARWNWRMETPS